MLHHLINLHLFLPFLLFMIAETRRQNDFQGSLQNIIPATNCPTPTNHEKEEDFIPLFDGKTLNGWEGDPVYWRIENGDLVGEVTPATLLQRNSFIIWRGGTTENFELKTLYKVTAEGNSGINYRSLPIPGVPYALKGYQCDIDGALRYTGSNYEERSRTTLAAMGQKVNLSTPSTNPDSLALYVKHNEWTGPAKKQAIAPIDSLRSYIKKDDWNECHIIVKGNRMQHFINGVLISEVTDRDKVNGRTTGLLGVQVHVGPPMKIMYRNMRLKRLK